jgi:hypothetical protein
MDSKIGYSIALVSTVAAVTLIAGGCRIGNYSSKSSSAESDAVTGYYDAIPQSLQFCASAGTTQCVTSSTTQIPAFISDNVTNPLALILQDEATGEALMTAAVGGQTAIPIWVGTDNIELFYANNTSPQALWLDSSCTTKTYLEEEGAIVRAAGHHVEGTNSGWTVGSLTLSVQVIQSFEGVNGSCQSELQAMSTCYQDINQCGSSSSATNEARQDRVREVFETYIQAGAMTAADIPNVTGVGYEVHYQ